MLLICFLMSFFKPLKAAYLITKNRRAAAVVFVAPCYVIKPLKAILAPLTRQKVIYTTLRQKVKKRAHNGIKTAYHRRNLSRQRPKPTPTTRRRFQGVRKPKPEPARNQAKIVTFP